MRLATFNLLNGTSPSTGLAEPDRLLTSAQALQADILAVQEVDRGQPRSHGVDQAAVMAEALRSKHFRFEPALIGTPAEQWRAAADEDTHSTDPAYGVALLSRWPVHAWHVVRLPPAPVRAPVALPGTRQVVWLQDEPRVGLAAVVEAPIGEVTVATTHLSFVPGWNARQLRTLTRALQALPGPRLLLGDLNLPGVLPGLLTGWRQLARAATYPVERPRLQLDHVLASGTLPPVVSVAAPALTVSDHRAVVVELQS